jgi:decaprenylphospho-beta-D-ribofuranose 2-oxidase
MPMPSTAPEPGPEFAARRRRLLAGWGRTTPTAALVSQPTSAVDLALAAGEVVPRGILARGLGRSYGDAAQNSGGRVIDTTAVLDFHLEPGTGLVRASAGASLDALMRELVPRGFFVPVTPGTRYVTVGGAVAADIHGKNHHQAGSWCNHVVSMTMALPDGSTIEVSPDAEPELFWATAGGLGLTGVILDVTFRCPAIESSRLLVDTDRTRDLDEVMALMETGDQDYAYSVAWIDLIARGASMGRSILGRGRFARRDEIPETYGPGFDDPGSESFVRAYDPSILVSAPPVVPSGLLNRLSVRAFNELWYRKAPVRRRDELQSIPQFFHPLDMVGDWNRIYGRRGFLQWQYALPFGAEETVRQTVERLSASGCTSFLAVLKRFGAGNPGPLSFPMPGWTLALDIPVDGAALGPLLDELDEVVVEAGGRIYLAKDSRVRPELLSAMYPRLDEWREVRARLDPDRRIQSDLARRLGLL